MCQVGPRAWPQLRGAAHHVWQCEPAFGASRRRRLTHRSAERQVSAQPDQVASQRAQTPNRNDQGDRRAAGGRRWPALSVRAGSVASGPGAQRLDARPWWGVHQPQGRGRGGARPRVLVRTVVAPEYHAVPGPGQGLVQPGWLVLPMGPEDGRTGQVKFAPLWYICVWSTNNRSLYTCVKCNHASVWERGRGWLSTDDDFSPVAETVDFFWFLGIVHTCFIALALYQGLGAVIILDVTWNLSSTFYQPSDILMSPDN